VVVVVVKQAPLSYNPPIKFKQKKILGRKFRFINLGGFPLIWGFDDFGFLKNSISYCFGLKNFSPQKNGLLIWGVLLI
jgi:hypothetical protein